MKKQLAVFILISLLLCCNITQTIYASDVQASETPTSVNTMKGKAYVYRAFEEKSFPLQVVAEAGAYFADFSMLFTSLDAGCEINISDSAALSVDQSGNISVFGTSAGVKAKENQWLDISICADPNRGNYAVDIDGTVVSGTSETVTSFSSMILEVKDVSTNGVCIYMTAPHTGSLGEGNLSVPGKRTYLTSFAETQGGAPDYVRDTINDPTGANKGKVQRLKLNNKPWMEGRAAASLSGGVWEISAELYFDDFGAKTNSLAGRMNGSTWLSFCTFNHDTKKLVLGNKKGTTVIYSNYNLQTWYRLSVIVDFSNHSYTVYLFDDTGKCLGSEQTTLDASYTSLSNLSLYLWESGHNSEQNNSTLYVHDYSYTAKGDSGVVSTTPHRGAINCAVDGNVYLKSRNSVDSRSLEQAVTSMTGNLSMAAHDTVKLSFGGLEKNKLYDVTVSGIKDIFGNELSAEFSFTTGNGIAYQNLTLDGGKVTLQYSGDISSEQLTIYAAAYSSETNQMTDSDSVDAKDGYVSVSATGDDVVRGYLWDEKMNILTPCVGGESNIHSQGEPCAITIAKDYDTNIAEIRGTAVNAATLILRDENNKIIMIDEPKASANGFFKSTFFTDTIGPVTLYFNLQDGAGIQTLLSTFYTRDTINGVAQSFGAEDADIDALIKTHHELFGFDLKEYGTVSAATVAAIMKAKTYTSFSDVVDSYNEAMAAALFNAAKDGEAAEALEKRYESTYGFDKTETYQYYLDCLKDTDTEKKATLKQTIFSNLAARNDYASIWEVVDEFEAQVVLSAIECSEINSEVIPILRANNNYLKLDFSDFEKVAAQSDVTSPMKGKKYEDIGELISAFHTLVKNAPKKKEPSDGNRTGGSGADKVKLSVTQEIVEEVETKAEVFRDIKEVPWAEKCIMYLYDRKIVDGKGDNEFKPNDTVTRAEFVKLVSLSFPKTALETPKRFSDVDETAWYYPYVTNACGNGWIYGVSEEMFGANDKITREDMAVILCRVANSLGITIEKEKSVLFYDDESISSYAKEAVYTLAEGNIVNGANDNEFLPKNMATRAEAAKLLYCLMQKTAQNG